MSRDYPEISEAERFPLLTPAGRRLLHAMRQDRHAPIWNWPNGEQLDEPGLEMVERFAQALRLFGPPSPPVPLPSNGRGETMATEPIQSPARLPDWLSGFVDFCLEDVPFYRRRSAPGTPLSAIPSCWREDLATRPWDFVPDSQPLDRLIVFSSSGTTGHPAVLPTHPATAACGIPLLEHAMAPLGVSFPRGAETIALGNITAYPGAYSTAIVVAYLEEAGCVRVNLCLDDWRDRADCPTYLDRWHAPVMLGDPLAFAALEGVDIRRKPKVLISSIMALSDAFAAELSVRYGCPVLDVYAMTETGILAVRTPTGHALLPHDIYVEILDENDQPCAQGVRGEITVTGGRNPFGPLLRYRTGDFASLAWHDGRPTLIELEGRRPVLFPTKDGRIVHSMEVSRLLRRFAIVQFRLHQDAEGGFHIQYRGRVDRDEMGAALKDLLGSADPLSIAEMPPVSSARRKVYEYHTDVQTPLTELARKQFVQTNL